MDRAGGAPEASRPPRFGSRYMLGQLCFVEELELGELEDDDEVDDFAEGLLVAACAIAAPPPTRAPDSVSAIRARVNRCRMLGHLLPVVVEKESTPAT